jgi:hypothetical protein
MPSAADTIQFLFNFGGAMTFVKPGERLLSEKSPKDLRVRRMAEMW